MIAAAECCNLVAQSGIHPHSVKEEYIAVGGCRRKFKKTKEQIVIVNFVFFKKWKLI